MFIIDFRNKLVGDNHFSIMGNNNVDEVYFYSHFTQYASGYNVYLKVIGNDHTYADKIAIDSSNISVEGNALLVKWTMGEVSTQCKKIDVQLQFENEEGTIIAQTRIVSIVLGDTINIDEEMSHIYPKVLKDLRDDVDELQVETSEQGEKLATIETGAQVNVIERVIINGQEKIPAGKTIAFSIPKFTSELINNSDFTTKLYVDTLIAEIEQRSDVVDVVGTYQDLLDYDTSTLAPNSLIKVINDETHDNEITYYRWVITAGVGAWVYVASEGAYYTTVQIDQMLLDYYKKDESLIPNENGTLDIGGTNNKFKDLYLVGKVDFGNNCNIKNDSGYISIFSNNTLLYAFGTSYFFANGNKDLGTNAFKWNNAYIKGSLYGVNYDTPLDDIYTTLYNLSENNSNAEIKWSKMLNFSKSADTTFTFETAKSGCLNEYKAIITNSGSNDIVITLPSGVSIETNDDSIVINANAFTLPSGVKVELNCVNNWCIVYNHNAQ